MIKLGKLKNDQSGTMYILLIALIFAAGVFAVIGYQYSLINGVYQQAGRTMERAGNVSVIVTKEDERVRDLSFDLDTDQVEAAFEQNLEDEGLTKKASGWIYQNKGKTVYELSNLVLQTDGEVLRVSGTLRIPLLWNLGGNTPNAEITVETASRLLYYLPN
jgi:hypothetical protein